jgi:hypothetical protein
MRKELLIAIAAAGVLAGCATFKELEPEPPLSPQERGYVELKNDGEDFLLDEGGHYFIKFPRPLQDNSTLLLRTGTAWYINAYMTRKFDDGREPIERMVDEAPVTDSTSIYSVDLASPFYFWVIDTVRQDVALRLHYRYLPRWRFTFENKYKEFKGTLSDNRADRSAYQGSTGATPFQSLNYRKELVELKPRTEKLEAMQKEITEVASLFPPGIAASGDTAYLNYKSISAALNDELEFQNKYAEALTIFQKEKSSRGDAGDFLSEAPAFTEFLTQKTRYPEWLLADAREVIGRRLDEALPYYEEQLRARRDPSAMTVKPPMESVTKLFRACNRPVPAEFASLSGFVKQFNQEAAALRSAGERLRELNAAISKITTPPQPEFYGNMEVSASDIHSSIPQSQVTADPRYGNLEAAQSLARELGSAAVQAEGLQALLGSGKLIASDLTMHAWASAERRTADLYLGRDGKSYETVAHHREKFVKWFEADIFNGVKNATRERLDAFTKASQGSFTNVPALYADSAFMPAYQLTFSSIGDADLAKKRAQINDYITHVRQVEFPENAIKTLYADFNRDMQTNGVERARAIVEHGKMYKGPDKQIGSIVNECDPMVAKWIVRPKEYRRVLAFPVTSNKRGVNEYVFRIKLQIPSDAQFPVFDVNVKLPKEVADADQGASWYDRITINNNPIKNEGRFRITAPLPANNYESQITPVQMDKAGNNILEVHFKKAAFKVYEISAMAQVPIMKKN